MFSKKSNSFILTESTTQVQKFIRLYGLFRFWPVEYSNSNINFAYA